MGAMHSFTMLKLNTISTDIWHRAFILLRLASQSFILMDCLFNALSLFEKGCRNKLDTNIRLTPAIFGVISRLKWGMATKCRYLWRIDWV
jgi:hypothetical protein